MNSEQIKFFKGLKNIQDYCINVALCKADKYDNTEKLLIDVTSDVIYRVMEMLDGYGEELSRCNIINSETGVVINEGIELHDKCSEFIINS